MRLKNRPPLLFTGTGSSGTRYITKVCKRGGIKIGHEHIHEDGMASWYAAAADLDPRTKEFFEEDINKMWTGDIRLDQFKARPVVLHQTRYPLHAISTFTRASAESWTVIYKVLHTRGVDILPEQSLTKRAMLYWLHWNLMCEEIAEWQYPVEYLPQLFETWCIRCHRSELIAEKDTMLRHSLKRRHDNSHRGAYRALRWNDLMLADPDLCKQIMTLGWKYGYYCV